MKAGMTTETGRRARICAAAIIAIFSSPFFVPPALAAEIVLQIDGISGESTVPGHVGQIDLLSAGQGVSNSYTPGYPSDPHANLQDISIVKFVDKATPRLFLSTLTGAHHANARIDFITVNGNLRKTFYWIELTNVVVTSMSNSGNYGESQFVENLSLAFDTIKWSYQPCDDAGNPVGSPIVVTWDQTSSKEQ